MGEAERKKGGATTALLSQSTRSPVASAGAPCSPPRWRPCLRVPPALVAAPRPSHCSTRAAFPRGWRSCCWQWLGNSIEQEQAWLDERRRSVWLGLVGEKQGVVGEESKGWTMDWEGGRRLMMGKEAAGT